MSPGKAPVTVKEAASALVASYAKDRWLSLTVEVGEPCTGYVLEAAIRDWEAQRSDRSVPLDLSRMVVALRWHEPGTARSSYVVSGIRRAEVRVVAGKMPWVETDGC